MSPHATKCEKRSKVCGKRLKAARANGPLCGPAQIHATDERSVRSVGPRPCCGPLQLPSNYPFRVVEGRASYISNTNLSI
jgi:hypothetical protein